MQTKSYYSSRLCTPLPIQTFSFTEQMTTVINNKTLCTLSMLNLLLIFINRNSIERMLIHGCSPRYTRKQTAPFPEEQRGCTHQVKSISQVTYSQPSEQTDI